VDLTVVLRPFSGVVTWGA